MHRPLTIAKRLSFGFGLLLIFVLICGVLGLSRLSAVNSMLERIVTKDWRKIVLANEAIDLMNANARETGVAASVNEISSALKEQSAASNEIAVNVDKIAQMSEENSAATQEAAATAVQLKGLALKTLQAIGRFRV